MNENKPLVAMGYFFHGATALVKKVTALKK
jgi:hypothetical protein